MQESFMVILQDDVDDYDDEEFDEWGFMASVKTMKESIMTLYK